MHQADMPEQVRAAATGDGGHVPGPCTAVATRFRTIACLRPMAACEAGWIATAAGNRRLLKLKTRQGFASQSSQASVYLPDENREETKSTLFLLSESGNEN